MRSSSSGTTFTLTNLKGLIHLEMVVRLGLASDPKSSHSMFYELVGEREV